MSWLAAPKFSVCSAVELRSGGQAMTISKLSDEQADCAWIDTTGRPRLLSVPVQCLVHHRIGDFNLIIEGHNATSHEIDVLTRRKDAGHA